MQESTYVIVTPARNEEEYIGRTIEAVLSQTILPRKWIIVSDGSVDRTDDIAHAYAQKHSFIRLLRAGANKAKGVKDFGSKVLAFRAGYRELSTTAYQFVGNIDADITFNQRYFEEVLDRFRCNPRLGLAGGIVLEPYRGGFVPQRTSLNSVCGSVQLFRRECYESFGGYVPIATGGVDAAAEIMARMHGWEVQTCPEIKVYAQRPVITGGRSLLHTLYRQGLSNYLLGYHPLFQLASSLARVTCRPFLIGSMSTLLGYGWSCLAARKRALPSDVVNFLRGEQLQRLASCCGAWNSVLE